MKRVLVHRWALAVALTAGMGLLDIGLGRAEEDHLKGYAVRDLNEVPGASGVAVTTQFGSETCTLRTPQYFLVQGEKNGGDDPRGGPAGHFVCYRATCTGPLPPVTRAESQFGLHNLKSKRARLVCLPVDKHVCGDNELDPGEDCDGTSDAACPSFCDSQCKCDAPCPASGGNPVACQAYADDNLCATCCLFAAGCNPVCEAAATAGCASSSDNDACAAQINATGCNQPCCN